MITQRQIVHIAITLTAAILVNFALLNGGRAEVPGRGKALFEKRCGGCHSLDGEKEGPRLRGVYGRRSGSVSTFNYSDALKKARITWDAESLDNWLAGPEDLVPDSDMAFRLANADERRDVIGYLKELSK
jgi:cytochrome c